MPLYYIYLFCILSGEIQELPLQADYSTSLTNNTVETHAIADLPRIIPTDSQSFHDRSHPVAVMFPSNNIEIESYYAVNLILDTNFPAFEPVTPEYDNTIFG